MIDSLSEIATSDMLIYNKTININGKEYKVMAIDLLNIRINKYINYISDNKKIDNINDIEIGIIPDTTFFKNEYPIKEKIEMGHIVNISGYYKKGLLSSVMIVDYTIY